MAVYDEDDLGMRNLAIVGLANARFSCKDVARCFGLTPQYVSMLRGRARERGSAGLVRPRGRRRSLSDAKLARAAEWSRQGMSNVAIGKRLGVHSGTFGRRLAAMEQDLLVGEPPAPDALFVNEEERFDHGDEEPSEPEATRGQISSDQPASPIADLRDTEVTSRYAGAMLLHPFLTQDYRKVQAVGRLTRKSAPGTARTVGDLLGDLAPERRPTRPETSGHQLPDGRVTGFDSS